MGLTYLELEVANAAKPDVAESLQLLIDSGALCSVVPAGVLEKLGIQPLDEQEFRLANGEKIVRKKGVAVFRYGKRVGGSDVVFGEEGDALLLGATTLESLGLSRPAEARAEGTADAAGLTSSVGPRHDG